MSHQELIEQYLHRRCQQAFNTGWYCGAAFGVAAGFGIALILFAFMGWLK